MAQSKFTVESFWKTQGNSGGTRLKEEDTELDESNSTLTL